MNITNDGYTWSIQGKWLVNKNMYIKKIHLGSLFGLDPIKKGQRDLPQALTVEVGFENENETHDQQGQPYGVGNTRYDAEKLSDSVFLNKVKMVLRDQGFEPSDLIWMAGGSSTMDGQLEFLQSTVSQDIADLVNRLEKK